MIDAEKRAFTAHQQVRIQTPTATLCMCVSMCPMCVCLMISGAVDGGEAESSRWSVRRLRGAFVSAVPGAASLGAGEGGRHRPAGATAGGAGRKHTHEECHQSSRFSASRFRVFSVFPGAKE